MPTRPRLSPLTGLILLMGALLWTGCEDNIIELDESGELVLEDLTVGTGDSVAVGQRLEIHAKGSLRDGGTVFMDSHSDNRPLVIFYGESDLLEGLEQGIADMKEGGVRKMTIPPRLAFGVREIDRIPPNSTVVFDIELLRVDDPDSLGITDIKVGTGAVAADGDTLTTYYLGYLPSGQIFDRTTVSPISFVLGSRQVITGWDQGLRGMREGGVRRLVIPPGLAYGNQGSGIIRPGDTIIFEVELVKVRKGS